MKGKKRNICYVFAGICMVLVVMSRPTQLIMGLAITSPILFASIFRESKKLQIGELLSVIIPVAIGAGFVCWYNYVRFGSILEFGSNYQLTVSDIRYNKIDIAFLPQAIYAYFFDFPKIIFESPYIRMENPGVLSTGNYVYGTYMIGILTFPLTYALIATRHVSEYGRKKKITVIVVTFAASIITAFLDFCEAGSNLRYDSDILISLLAVSSLVLTDINSNGNLESENGKLIYKISSIICGLTILIGTLFIFVNERYTIYI
jgi:hypothetical protein